jgi:hypothetical protein
MDHEHEAYGSGTVLILVEVSVINSGPIVF